MSDLWTMTMAQKIEAAMGDLVDMLAANPGLKIDGRAWRQLMIYAPVSARLGDKAQGDVG